jgi:hypothetical protein
VQEVIAQERVRIDSVVVGVEVDTVDTVLEVGIAVADFGHRILKSMLLATKSLQKIDQGNYECLTS